MQAEKWKDIVSLWVELGHVAMADAEIEGHLALAVEQSCLGRHD